MQTSKQTLWQDHWTPHLCWNSPCASHACSEKMCCPSASLSGCKSSLRCVNVSMLTMMACSVYFGTHHLSSDNSCCVLLVVALSVHIQHWLAALLIITIIRVVETLHHTYKCFLCSSGEYLASPKLIQTTTTSWHALMAPS